MWKLSPERLNHSLRIQPPSTGAGNHPLALQLHSLCSPPCWAPSPFTTSVYAPKGLGRKLGVALIQIEIFSCTKHETSEQKAYMNSFCFFPHTQRVYFQNFLQYLPVTFIAIKKRTWKIHYTSIGV